MSPKEPVIDWTGYEAVEIRMLAEGGKEIKIKIGNEEFKQKLGPLGQYNDYRFEVRIGPPGVRPLAIMPTDGLLDLVAIKSIRLAPRKADFTQAAGRQFLGKRDEYRNTLYLHSPSTLAFEVKVPENGELHVGLGITEVNAPIKFQIAADSKEVYSKTVSDDEVWVDDAVDLSAYGGRNVKMTF